MIRVYKLSSNPSSRKAIAHLEAVGQDFEVRNMGVEPLTFEELKDILKYTDNGTEDIIAVHSKAYKNLVAVGIDFNELPLSELHMYVKRFPRLIKAPLIIGKGIMHIGYNEEGFTEFEPRGIRLEKYLSQLKELRKEDIRKIEAGELITSGSRGKDEWATTRLVSVSQ
jgi:regulatory protein spx